MTVLIAPILKLFGCYPLIYEAYKTVLWLYKVQKHICVIFIYIINFPFTYLLFLLESDGINNTSLWMDNTTYELPDTLSAGIRKALRFHLLGISVIAKSF